MSITRKDLEHLRGLKVEIESLRAIRPKPSMVSIFYKDYRTGKGIPKTDVGLDDGREELQDLATKIADKISEREGLISSMEDWIEQIDNPVDRAIIRYYYVEGLSQQEIGNRTGYAQSSISRILSALWESVEGESDEAD